MVASLAFAIFISQNPLLNSNIESGFFLGFSRGLGEEGDTFLYRKSKSASLPVLLIKKHIERPGVLDRDQLHTIGDYIICFLSVSGVREELVLVEEDKDSNLVTSKTPKGLVCGYAYQDNEWFIAVRGPVSNLEPDVFQTVLMRIGPGELKQKVLTALGVDEWFLETIKGEEYLFTNGDEGTRKVFLDDW